MKNALNKLKEGNQRFIAGSTIHDAESINASRIANQQGQKPFAVILGCSDSRVPAELIFDQGLGDLFVVRVAGNIAASTQIGSIEFAVSMFESPLVIVLGHSSCGAIHASLNAMKNPEQKVTKHIESLVKQIKPAINSLAADGLDTVDAADAVKANVMNSVADLCNQSEVIKSRIAAGLLQVEGAHYDLQTGLVEFYEKVDE